MRQDYTELLNYLYTQTDRKRDMIDAYSRQGMDTAYPSGEYDAYHDIITWIRNKQKQEAQGEEGANEIHPTVS